MVNETSSGSVRQLSSNWMNGATDSFMKHSTDQKLLSTTALSATTLHAFWSSSVLHRLTMPFKPDCQKELSAKKIRYCCPYHHRKRRNEDDQSDGRSLISIFSLLKWHSDFHFAYSRVVGQQWIHACVATIQAFNTWNNIQTLVNFFFKFFFCLLCFICNFLWSKKTTKKLKLFHHHFITLSIN